MGEQINVLVWSERRETQNNKKAKEIYPDGINSVIADFLKNEKMSLTKAELDQKEHGLTADKLNDTDVLIWWGHVAHDKVKDEIVERIYQRVLEGMGLIVLHSAHHSKIFKKLMGTSCNLKWRVDSELERLWIVSPGHPIVKDLENEYIEIEKEEMYGEYFDIPKPDEIVLISWFEGGEVFRSGITYQRGQGKIFYFRPGHEENPTYYNKEVQQIIKNAVKWANKSNKGITNYGNSPNQLGGSKN